MSHITRRRFSLCAAAALLTPSGAFAAYPAELAFAAFRKGKRIGEQRMTFEPGEILTVRTRAEMAIKIGPVTAYRYLHEAVERWRGDQFETLETRTLAGGSRESVVATRTASGVVIRGSKANVTAAPGALPFTHWNPKVARAPLFHPQSGKLLRVSAREAGQDPVLLADGRTVEARRVSFTGDAQIDDWYGADGIWTGLRGRLEDGSALEYRRL